MALVKCPECGKEVSDTVESCIHCGCVLNKEGADVKVVTKKTGILNSKIIVSIVAVCCIVAIIIGVFIYKNRVTGLEANAKKYVKELENIIGNITVTDVVCFSHISYGEEEISYKYLIEYTYEGEKDFALFFDDEEIGYAGNGYNGGSSNDSMQISINNLNALSAQKDYLEYLLGKGDNDVITAEDAAKNNAKGIIPLDMEKIKR